MKVSELIKELEKLPKDSTIGVIDRRCQCINGLTIEGKKDITWDCTHRHTIAEIEEYSYNSKYKSDYYIY